MIELTPEGVWQIELVNGLPGATGLTGLTGPTGPTGVIAATAPATYNAPSQTVGVIVGTTTGSVAAGNDPRLSDARVPTTHAATHGAGGTDPVTVTDASVSATAAIAESKLALASDAAAGVGSKRTLGAGATQAAAGNDSRLSDARTPTDGSVTTVKLAAGSVTAVKVAADVATQAELDALSAASAKVATGPAATYGTDPVTNGSFTGSASGWTLGGGAVYGTNNVTLVAGSTVEQSVSVVAGTQYQIEWTGTGGTITVALGAAAGTSDGSAVALVAPSTGVVTLRLTFSGAGSVDDITARPVSPSAAATTVGGIEVRLPVASSFAIGTSAQRSLTTGANNTGIGFAAQRSLTTGVNNVGVGFAAQFSLTTGANNTAIGVNAQRSLTTGVNNTGFGVNAQYSPAGLTANATTTGLRQTMIGVETGQSSATQINDAVGVGYWAVCGADKAMALGAQARADHAGSVALGSDTLTTLAGQVMVGPRDVEITDATKGIVLLSPGGSRYRVTVSNTGTLTATPA